MRDGTLGDVRVINYSAGMTIPDAVDWDIEAHDRGPVCGEGPHDDGPDGGTVDANGLPGLWCTPDIDDGWMKEVAEQGKKMMLVAERALNLGVVIVTSAGNDGETFCEVPPTASGDPCTPSPMTAEANSGLGWAAAHWNDDLTHWSFANPIITVAAVGDSVTTATGGEVQASTARTSFSNVGAAVSAPGSAFSTAVWHVPELSGHLPYGWEGGTSQAAPQVAALAGYLLAYDPP